MWLPKRITGCLRSPGRASNATGFQCPQQLCTQTDPTPLLSILTLSHFVGRLDALTSFPCHSLNPENLVIDLFNTDTKSCVQSSYNSAPHQTNQMPLSLGKNLLFFFFLPDTSRAHFITSSYLHPNS